VPGSLPRVAGIGGLPLRRTAGEGSLRARQLKGYGNLDRPRRPRDADDVVEAVAGARGGGKGLGRHLADTLLGSAAVRIAGMGLTFLVGGQLARYLGPEN
jgi:hypothetical protein